MTDTSQKPALTSDRTKRVEAGLQEFHRAYQDAEELQRQLNALGEKYKLAELEIDRLTQDALDRREQADHFANVARQAVAERVAYETIFRVIFDILRKFVPPVIPERVSSEERMGAPDTSAQAIERALTQPNVITDQGSVYARSDCPLETCDRPGVCRAVDACTHPMTRHIASGDRS